MKKVLFVIVALFAFSMQGVAQKGMQGFGVNLAANVSLGDQDGAGFGGGLKYQYNITDYLRFEPSFCYYAVSDNAFDMLGFANMHIFFSSPKAFRPYLFAGLGYIDFSDSYYSYYHDKKERETEGDFGFDVGLGLDYRMSHNFSLQVEAGAVIGVGDDDHFGAKINIGFCYNF